MPIKAQSPPNAGFVLGLNDGMLGLLGAGVLLFTAVLWTAHAPNAEKTDFSLTYVGAKIVHQGLGRSLYDQELQKQLRDALFQHPVPLFFEHPPFEAALLAPLAAYSFRLAYLVWGLINATAWLVTMIFMRRYLPWPREDLGYLVMWLLFAPLWVALYQGQSSLLLLAFFSLTLVLLDRGKEFAAGAALGLGLVKFQFVLPFVLILFFRKKWRFVGGLAVSVVALALLSIATVGLKGLIDYARFLFAIGSNPQNISYGSGVDMPTIHGFVYALLGARIGHAGLNIIVGLLSIALLAWVALRWQAVSRPQQSDLMFAAAIAASLLSGSHMFTHDFSPLILAMLIGAGFLSNSRTPLSARVVVRSTLVLFWLFPVYFLFVKWHCLYLMAPALFLLTWGTAQSAKFVEQPAEMKQMVAG